MGKHARANTARPAPALDSHRQSQQLRQRQHRVLGPRPARRADELPEASPSMGVGVGVVRGVDASDDAGLQRWNHD
jgi:hypothetical protein